MSNDEPQFPEVLPPAAVIPPPVLADDYSQFPVRRPKFQHRYGVHLLFFALTFFTTTFREAFTLLWVGMDPMLGFTWPLFKDGLW